MRKLRARQDGGATGSAGTLASSAYRAIREDILSGALPAGQKLRIHQLCVRYDVGLSPMREALNRVSRDGLILHMELRGFRTAPVSVCELEELTKTRCWVNEIALRHSIADGDQAWEENILVAFHRLSRTPRFAANHQPNPAWGSAHRIFHSGLIAACGSSYLVNFCEQLFDAAERYHNIARTENTRIERVDEHRALLDAALAHDQDQAVELLKKHFQRTAELSREAVSRREAAERQNGLPAPRTARKKTQPVI